MTSLVTGDDLDQWSWLEEWLLTPEEATNNYCITQCPCGKAKVAELLKECDSVWDVVDEMKCYTKQCSKTPACELTPHEDQPQLN